MLIKWGHKDEQWQNTLQAQCALCYVSCVPWLLPIAPASLPNHRNSQSHLTSFRPLNLLNLLSPLGLCPCYSLCLEYLSSFFPVKSYYILQPSAHRTPHSQEISLVSQTWVRLGSHIIRYLSCMCFFLAALTCLMHSRFLVNIYWMNGCMWAQGSLNL